MRRLITPIILTFALAAPIGLASPATASTATITVTCSGGPLSASPSSFSADVGDVVTVLNSAGTPIQVSTTGTTGNGILIGPGASGTFTVTSSSGGQLVFNPTGGSCTFKGVNFTASGGGGEASGASALPSPVLQQFGKPFAGSCDAVAPASLDWSGVASGGWGESWAEWMNGGLGGAVCTRTLVYSNALGKWTVE